MQLRKGMGKQWRANTSRIMGNTNVFRDPTTLSANTFKVVALISLRDKIADFMEESASVALIVWFSFGNDFKFEKTNELEKP